MITSRGLHLNVSDICYQGRESKLKLAYCVFVNATTRALPFFERNKIPFVFTIYPGGGFSMTSAYSSERLKRIVSSRYFVKVFVHHSIIRDYLLRNSICPEFFASHSSVEDFPNSEITKCGEKKPFGTAGKADF